MSTVSQAHSNSEWKTNGKKKCNKIVSEETYFLLELLNKSACLRCMNKSCKIDTQHGIPFPDKICTFVQNPIYINGLGKIIEDSKLNFNGKKPFYTVCNYVHKNCKNCEEGRIKYISFNNEKIILCHPILENIRNKVTIGVHIDIKLILKGSKYEVFPIPVPIQFKMENPVNYYEEEELPVIKNSDSYNLNNWPSLNNSEISEDTKVKSIQKDFSKIKVLINNGSSSGSSSASSSASNEALNDALNNTSNDELVYRLRENLNNCEKSHNTPYQETKIYHDMYDEICYLSNENNLMLEEIDRLNNLIEKTVKTENEAYLINHNRSLMKEINKLKHSNKVLEQNEERDRFIIKNNHRYNEILDTLQNLNTRVSDQFFNTHYSEYIRLV